MEDAFLLHSDLHLLREAGYWDGFVRLLDASGRTRGFGDYYGYGLVAPARPRSTSRWISSPGTWRR